MKNSRQELMGLPREKVEHFRGGGKRRSRDEDFRRRVFTRLSGFWEFIRGEKFGILQPRCNSYVRWN